MRRIVIAFASTVTGLVLLFAYPTSLNRSTAVAATSSVGDGSSVTEESSGSTADDGASGATSDDGTTSSGGSGTASGDSGTSSGTTSGVSGTFTGDSVQTRYGAVQVEIVVTDGVVTSADAVSYPSRDRESQQINSWAVPALNDEVVSAQSASISMISGATVTSVGYLTSLQSAFDAAGL